MRSSAELICVDPARVHEFWPHARQLIKNAIEATNLSRFEDIEKDVLESHSLLWLAWSGSIEAAAVTHLYMNVCTIVAVSGLRRDRWIELREQIEKYAKDEGCRRVRLYGRKGWQRVLKDYRVEHVIMEKAL